MAKREKPLNVLIITGAGASANLGVDDTALPMMGGWAEDLAPRLGFVASQLGLTADTDGPTFEAIIGRFLAFSNALNSVVATNLGPLMGDQTAIVGDNGRNSSGGNFANWSATAEANIEAMNVRLWESLWENFGRDRIDAEKADRAYSALHDLIRESRGDDSQPCYIAHATTNFDSAIEVAIQDSKNTELLDGFTPVSGNARPRWAPNLLTAGRLDTDARIPVVHLHGAVGWYFDPMDRDRIRRYPSDDAYDQRLSPALLLPDDTKRPDLFPKPLTEVWEQFIILLQQATHVFVIGHSLHDDHLVKAINQAEVPTAVMKHRRQNESGLQWGTPHQSEIERIRKAIPNATVIRGEFGRGGVAPDFDTDTFTKWLDRN